MLQDMLSGFYIANIRSEQKFTAVFYTKHFVTTHGSCLSLNYELCDKLCKAAKLNETNATVYLVIIYHIISMPLYGTTLQLSDQY